MVFIFQDDPRSDTCSCRSLDSAESESGTEIQNPEKKLKYKNLVALTVRCLAFFTAEGNSLLDNLGIFHATLVFFIERN